MPGRKYAATGKYRYGFNGKENDNDVKGEGNQQDYGMRIYDPRLVRFLSTDPLTKNYPQLTPYQFASNRPIDGIDLDGKEWTSTKSTDPATGITTISYNVQIKVITGILTEEKVKSVMELAQKREADALNATSDGKTIYTVIYNYTTIKKEDSEAESKKGLVIDFTDYREKNIAQIKSGQGTVTEGNNKSNTQKGLIEISTFSAYIDTKSKNGVSFTEQTIESLASIVNHEFGHGARLSHPMSETIPDIAQYLNENGKLKLDENGKLIRSSVSGETIKNNIMNTGDNTLFPPDKLSDLKNLTKGQADYLQKVVEYEQKIK